MVAQLCEYPKNYWIVNSKTTEMFIINWTVDFQRVEFMIHGLYFSKDVIFLKVQDVNGKVEILLSSHVLLSQTIN